MAGTKTGRGSRLDKRRLSVLQATGENECAEEGRCAHWHDSRRRDRGAAQAWRLNSGPGHARATEPS